MCHLHHLGVLRSEEGEVKNLIGELWLAIFITMMLLMVLLALIQGLK